VTTAYAHGVQVAKSIQNAEMAGVAGLGAAVPIGMVGRAVLRGSAALS